MLFAWKQSAAEHETSKEVLLLAAGYNSAIESEIVEVKTGVKLRQLLTKPFHPGAAEPFVCEPKGRIDHLYTFATRPGSRPSSYITVDVSARSGLQADRVVVEFHETGFEAAAELERAADAAEGAGAKPQWFARLRRRLGPAGSAGRRRPPGGTTCAASRGCRRSWPSGPGASARPTRPTRCGADGRSAGPSAAGGRAAGSCTSAG